MKKVLNILFVSLMAVIVLLNVNIGIQDGAVNDFLLFNIEALAQETQASASTGPTQSSTVQCSSSTTTTTTTNNGDSSDFGFSGGINAGKGLWGGNVNGNYNSGNNNSTSTTTTTTTTSSWTAKKYYCPSQDKSSCKPYNPCN